MFSIQLNRVSFGTDSKLYVNIVNGKIVESETKQLFAHMGLVADMWNNLQHTLDYNPEFDLINSATATRFNGAEIGTESFTLVRESSHTQIHRLKDCLVAAGKDLQLVEMPSLGLGITLLGNVWLSATQRHNSDWHKTNKCTNGRLLIGNKEHGLRYNMRIPKDDVECGMLLQFLNLLGSEDFLDLINNENWNEVDSIIEPFQSMFIYNGVV